MRNVIAALDTSMAARPVLLAGLALGRMLDGEVEALHVREDGDRTPRAAAAAEQVSLRIARGPVTDALVEATEAEGVLALVLGARGTPLRHRAPLGSTALAVATAVTKPVLVVPPDARRPDELRRVLVPLEGRGRHAPRGIIELAQAAELDLVVLHVMQEESLPPFTDQPQHEQPARVEEFLRRYCPWGIDSVRFEVRLGRPDELVPLVAEQEDVDVIVLGWAQDLAPDRAPIVRAVLGRAHVPVLLVPVQTTARAASPPTREESWSSLQSSPV